MAIALRTVTTLASDGDSRAGDVLRLRREISRMQRRRSDLPVLPLDPALSSLLPDQGLQTGSAYSVSPSPSLVLALMSTASQKGIWSAVIGMPTLGVEAAAGFGINLDRLLLVPDPGERWLTVASALSEVVPLIAVHPGTRVRDADVARLGARLRDRGCTLLVTGAWPQSEGSIQVRDPEWHGLGSGWGLLSERTVTVTAQSRRSPLPRSVRVQLPGHLGTVEALPAAVASVPSVISVAPSRWAAVG